VKSKMDYYTRIQEINKEIDRTIHHAKEKKEAFSISKLCIEMGKAYGASKSMVMKILRTHEENGNIEIAGDTFITTNNGGKK